MTTKQYVLKEYIPSPQSDNMDPHGHPQEIKEWTSQQLNLIFTKVKVNIHSLLNILKSYYAAE